MELNNIPEPKNDKQYAVMAIVCLVVTGITVGVDAILKLFPPNDNIGA